MSLTPAPDLSRYWDHVVFYLRHACALFGEPEQLARQAAFKPHEHKLLCAFFRPLEAIVRGLIFMTALERTLMLHPRPLERKFRARLPAPRNRPEPADINDATTWRVNFRLCASARKSRRRSKRRPDPNVFKPPIVLTAASAERFEALVRAYQNRDQLAGKLARRFALQPGRRFAHLPRPNQKLAHKPVYTLLFELAPVINDALQRAIMRPLSPVNSS